MTDDDLQRGVEGTMTYTIEPGTVWKRPLCWVFGHEWRDQEDWRTCVRCGAGTLSDSRTVEAEEWEVFTTSYNPGRESEPTCTQCGEPLVDYGDRLDESGEVVEKWAICKNGHVHEIDPEESFTA